MPTGLLDQAALERAVDARLSSEWLSLYLTHYRRRLNSGELAELADALERNSMSASRLTTLASERTGTKGRWLIEFLANVKSSALRGVLVRDAVSRLRAAR